MNKNELQVLIDYTKGMIADNKEPEKKVIIALCDELERIIGKYPVGFASDKEDTYRGKVNSRGLKEKTLYDYESRIKLIKLHFNDCPIENVTPRDVATFISEYPKKAMAKLLRSTMLDA
ncbi:TPA: hypothetical protein ACKRU7_003496, partial [Proteus mirabilis]